ncbi:MAG: hypothetical protein GX307_07585 [Euryarchaeota archaeon]|nr:hypothetical protein [Euryarchaeota archaeon]
MFREQSVCPLLMSRGREVINSPPSPEDVNLRLIVWPKEIYALYPPPVES